MMHKLSYFHGELHYFFKYSDLEYQDGIFKLVIKGRTQKQMTRFGFGRTFHDLNYFELGFMSTSLEFII